MNKSIITKIVSGAVLVSAVGAALAAAPGGESPFTRRTPSGGSERVLRDVSRVRPVGRAAHLPAAVTPSEAHVFGCMIASDSWGYYDKPVGIYAIDPNSGSCTSQVPAAVIDDGNPAGTYAKGKFYVSLVKDFYGNINSLRNITVDMESGHISTYEYPAPTYDDVAINMTYDAVNDIIYSINYDGDTDHYRLCKFLPESNSYTYVAPLEEHYWGLCVSGEGEIFAIDDNGALVQLDPATGEKSRTVVETGFSPALLQSCCWSPTDNSVYWAAYNYSSSQLIRITPATAKVERLCSFADNQEFIGLYCTDPVAKPLAPAAPALSLNYAEPGSTSAELSVGLPSLTVDGSPLAGTVSVNVTLDGTPILEMNEQPSGATVMHNLILPEGAHVIEAYCANGHGRGIRASLRTFTGTDSPVAAELTGSVSQDYTVTLGWDAPAQGASGGWFDPSELSYTLLRDGKVIADNIRETSFTDRPGDELHAYLYTLRTLYAGSECGASLLRLVCGDCVALPYSVSFSDTDPLALFHVIDNNKDGSTWSHDDNQGTLQYNYNSRNAGDDYAVLPRMRFTAGNVYHIELTARSISSSFPEKFEIVYGDRPEVSALTTVVLEPQTVPEDPTLFKADFTAPASGTGHLAVHCVSDADMSTLSVFDIRVEELGSPAAPAAPLDFKAVATGEGTGVALSLTVPSETFGGTPLSGVDAIVLTRNGKPVDNAFPANPAAGAVLTFDDVADFGFNNYEARAVSGGLRGIAARAKVFAGTYTLPFSITPDADEFTLFTVEPSDNEWYFDPSNNALKIITYGAEQADAYVFTPVVELGDANLVDLTFDAQAVGYDVEEVEITFGTTPARATHTSAGKFSVSGDGWQTFRLSFDIPSPGRYYIGVHGCSPARSTALLVKNIRMENGSLKLCPAAPEALRVTAGANGALTAAVTFDAPTLDLNGDAVQGPLSATLTREDGTVASTIEGLVPGQKSCKLTDEAALAGQRSYTVTVSNSYGAGGSAQVSGWFGTDVPGGVISLTASEVEDNLGAVLRWEKPLDTETLHGGYVDASNLKYYIYQLVDGRDMYRVGQTTGQEYEVRASEDYQDIHTYYVAAASEAGEGVARPVTVVLGPPATLPLVETASGGIVTCQPWVVTSETGDVAWGLADYIGSLDLMAADGGMFVASAKLPERRPGTATMIVPKLDISEPVAPVLTFKLYRYVGADATLNVKVSSYDGLCGTAGTYGVAAARDGWQDVSIDLSSYRSKPWIAISFEATLSDGASYVIVDDVTVQNAPDDDLAVTSVRGRNTAEVGLEVKYDVVVSNLGRNAHSFTVEHYVDGRLAATAKGAEVRPGASAVAEFTFTPEAGHLAAPIRMEMRLVADGWTDQDPTNDAASFPLNVVQAALPVVTDLVLAKGDAGTASLSWTAPDLSPKPVTDNFCDYESFAYDDFGPYTFHDGDGLIPCGIYEVTFPNMGTPMAFQIWEPQAEGVDVDADIWAPRSGNKCLVSWTALSQSLEPFNDDWLISPEIFSGNQPSQISFYAKRPVVDPRYVEVFEVLYSTGSTDTEDFRLLATEKPQRGGWEQYTYTLPAGAKRFAIRYCAKDAFAMLFDDLTYTPVTETSSLVILGYDLYRDGTKIASTTADTFVDESPAPHSVYTLRVRYDRGTSLDSNRAYMDPADAGIADAVSDGIVVRTGRNLVEITAAEGQSISLMSADGRLVWRTDRATAHETVRVASGAYILTTPTRAHKLIVP